MVVSNIFYFHPYLGKIPILTNIFHMGWNHQLGKYICTNFPPFSHGNFLEKLEAFATGWDQINRGLRAFEPSGDYVTALIQKFLSWFTPPKFNMEPKKNDGFQKESPLPGGPHFRFLGVQLQGLKSWWGDFVMSFTSREWFWENYQVLFFSWYCWWLKSCTIWDG